MLRLCEHARDERKRKEITERKRKERKERKEKIR